MRSHIVHFYGEGTGILKKLTLFPLNIQKQCHVKICDMIYHKFSHDTASVCSMGKALTFLEFLFLLHKNVQCDFSLELPQVVTLCSFMEK